MPPPMNGRPPFTCVRPFSVFWKDYIMHNIIYLVGLIVVVVAILSFLGLA